MAARPDTVLATVVPTAATSEEEARKTAPPCFVAMAETDVATGAAAVATVGRRPRPAAEPEAAPSFPAC